MIVGQEKTTKEIEKIFNILKSSHGEIRPHFVLTGSSGSGKTFTVKSLAKKYKLNFVEVNAAQITKEGTSGNSLSKALKPLANYSDSPTIVFVDEFDKLFISGNSNNSLANEVTVGVQNEFLKVLESEETSVFGNYGNYDTINISKVLFVFAGAFNGEENIGIDKLRKFGVKTEFLGRVGLVYNLNRLTLDNLYSILEYSDLLAKYLELFKNVNKEDVLTPIKKFLADNYENNTIGARMINTLINQWFIKGGKLGFEDVERSTFQTKMEL